MQLMSILFRKKKGFIGNVAMSSSRVQLLVLQLQTSTKSLRQQQTMTPVDYQVSATAVQQQQWWVRSEL